MVEQKEDYDPRRLRLPGILIRLDGTAEVFYIDEKTLESCRLPPSFQIGGKHDPKYFRDTDVAEADREKLLKTGDELQRELNKSSLFRKTNLLNAFYCGDGPFMQGEQGDDRVESAVAVSKNHKPITRFPSL